MNLKKEIIKIYHLLQNSNETKKFEDTVINLLKKYDYFYYRNQPLITNPIYDDFKKRIRFMFPYLKYFEGE